MKYFIFIVLCLGYHVSVIVVKAKPQSKNRLTELISHYEPVHYDKEAFHRNHHRTKRSTDAVLHLDITAFGEHLPLRLKREVKSVAQDIHIETSDGKYEIPADFTYEGVVEGLPDSTVYGVVTSNGLFEGVIRTTTTVYRIESASQYSHLDTSLFHSLIYRDSDIEYHKVRGASKCDSNKLHQKIGRNLHKENSKSAMNRDHLNPDTRDETPAHDFTQRDTDEGKKKYYKPRKEHRRVKRAVDYTKTQCPLYVQIGHKYFEYWKTTEAVIEQVAQHVQAVNDIYKITDFDLDGTAEGITFIVNRIKIWSDSSESGYKFASNYAVETFLTMFSDNENFDSYCLAYIYTYRDYDGGTLGLAWTGSTTSAGGVCERAGTFSGVQKSLNAGLISILNYGQVQPQLISFVTFAHEIGHNFGSPHDTEGDATCVPGGDSGNYIMYPKATDGNKPNNNKFSPCSINSMWSVVSVKAMDSSGCFQVPVTTHCGNGIVEDGEECDCGYDTDCTDSCCNPQVSTGSSSTACTLKSSAQCSPSQGSCCGTDCQLITTSQNVTCRDSTGCTAAATCNGVNVTCPASTLAADGTVCSSSKVCQSGSCTGSLCLIYNMVECQCSPAVADDYSDVILCQLCCQANSTSNSSTSSACQSSYSISSIPDVTVDPGTSCMDFQGFCDVFQKCRAIIPVGTLSNLINASALKDWLTNNWYFPLAGGIVLVILLILMVKCCAPKKKSDKPKKSKVSPKKGPKRRNQALTPPKGAEESLRF